MNERELFFIFGDVNMEIFKVISSKYKELGLNVTPVQSRIIMCIHNCKTDVCQKDLEKAMPCNKSTLSNILNTMEKNGLIKKTVLPIDCRKNIIELTDKAYEIMEIIDKNINDISLALCSGITPQEIETFGNVIEKVKSNLERI